MSSTKKDTAQATTERGRTEETLRQLQRQNELILKSAGEGIYGLDTDGCTTFVNPAAARMIGWEPQDLIGKPQHAILHHSKSDGSPYDRQDCPIYAAFKDGRVHQVDTEVFWRKDGTSFPVEYISTPIRDDDKLVGAVVTFRDITERKRSEAAIENLAKFPDENPNPVLRISRDGVVVYANKGSAPVLKVCGSQTGQPFSGRWRELVTSVFASGQHREVEVTCGKQIFMLTFAPVAGSDYLNVYGLDITKRKRGEEALRDAHAAIEQLKNRLQAENVYLQDEIKTEHNFENIITQSDAFKKILGKIERVASTDATVLILGETGTGKELLARAVHNISLRRDRPLVKVNCAALPMNLIESELFGHEKGAFTGAVARRIGRFELAHDGTIFLDEIGDLPVDLQAKLLRVLQEGEFERLGDTRTIKVNVRVLAATNRNLKKLIEEGRFREDLYYRLNGFPIEALPLRERKGDIPLLVKHFVKKFGLQLGRKIESIPQNVMNALTAYAWPGNIRELENVIERAIIISRGNILLMDELPTSAQPAEVKDSGSSTLMAVERNHILSALKACDWVVEGRRGAAKQLDISPSTLRDRMREYHIKRPPRKS